MSVEDNGLNVVTKPGRSRTGQLGSWWSANDLRGDITTIATDACQGRSPLGIVVVVGCWIWIGRAWTASMNCFPRNEPKHSDLTHLVQSDLWNAATISPHNSRAVGYTAVLSILKLPIQTAFCAKLQNKLSVVEIVRRYWFQQHMKYVFQRAGEQWRNKYNIMKIRPNLTLQPQNTKVWISAQIYVFCQNAWSQITQ